MRVFSGYEPDFKNHISENRKFRNLRNCEYITGIIDNQIYVHYDNPCSFLKRKFVWVILVCLGFSRSVDVDLIREL